MHFFFYHCYLNLSSLCQSSTHHLRCLHSQSSLKCANLYSESFSETTAQWVLSGITNAVCSIQLPSELALKWTRKNQSTTRYRSCTLPWHRRTRSQLQLTSLLTLPVLSKPRSAQWMMKMFLSNFQAFKGHKVVDPSLDTHFWTSWILAF